MKSVSIKVQTSFFAEYTSKRAINMKLASIYITAGAENIRA